MLYFLEALYLRNPSLFIFGVVNILAALTFLLLTKTSRVKVRGINAWYKPFKFALSIAVFSFTMAWLSYDLQMPVTVCWYNYAVILLLGFEVVYIALQAGRGKLSHYNFSSPLYAFLAAMMGIAAAAVTIWTGYIGILFCTARLPQLPDYYVLSIISGIFLFVIFAFQGAAMGARSTHTVGGPEGGPSIPVLNWSTRYDDLRIAHFVGMHALQVLPLLSWYVLKNTFAVVIASGIYLALAAFVWLRALQGVPLLKFKHA